MHTHINDISLEQMKQLFAGLLQVADQHSKRIAELEAVVARLASRRKAKRPRRAA